MVLQFVAVLLAQECSIDVSGDTIEVGESYQIDASLCFENNISGKVFLIKPRSTPLFLDSESIIYIKNSKFTFQASVAETVLFEKVFVVQFSNVTIQVEQSSSYRTLINEGTSIDISQCNILVSTISEDSETDKVGVSVFEQLRFVRMSASRLTLLFKGKRYLQYFTNSAIEGAVWEDVEVRVETDENVSAMIQQDVEDATRILFSIQQEEEGGWVAQLCKQFKECYTEQNGKSFYKGGAQITEEDFKAVRFIGITELGKYYINTANSAAFQAKLEDGATIQRGICWGYQNCSCTAGSSETHCACVPPEQLYGGVCRSYAVNEVGNTCIDTICTQCGPQYNLQGARCFKNCHSSCSLTHQLGQDCQCQCALPVQVKDGACTKTCINPSQQYAVNDGRPGCFSKCLQGCKGGDAVILDSGAVLFLSCDKDRELVSGQCVPKVDWENTTVIAIGAFIGTLVLTSIILVAATYCRVQNFKRFFGDA